MNKIKVNNKILIGLHIVNYFLLKYYIYILSVFFSNIDIAFRLRDNSYQSILSLSFSNNSFDFYEVIISQL